MDHVHLVSVLCCGIQQVLLIAEKFLALCALRCHSILLVVSNDASTWRTNTKYGNDFTLLFLAADTSCI